jgi:hypothetical protein
MSNDFLEYYHRESKKHAVTEEEQLALHKKQMEMESKRHQLEDDDDFYNEEVPVQESTRVNVPTKKLPPKRPIVPPAPRQVPSRPAAVPATPAPAPVNRVRTRASSQMDEALAMIDKITDKITGMFFKYGFDGLEKISRHLNEDIEEIVNPQPTYREDYNESYNANEERILELEEENNKLRRLLERQLERSKAEAAETPVARKPVKPVIEETTIDESVDDVPEELEEVDESYGMPETDSEKLNEQFISMNQNMDINALGASLTQQAAIQKRSESAGDTRLAQVAARAEMLQQSMNKKIDDKIASVEQQQAESFQQSEELEIIDVEEPTQPIENVKSTPAAESKKKVSKKKKSK